MKNADFGAYFEHFKKCHASTYNKSEISLRSALTVALGGIPGPSLLYSRTDPPTTFLIFCRFCDKDGNGFYRVLDQEILQSEIAGFLRDNSIKERLTSETALSLFLRAARLGKSGRHN
jgi:hypothetical protein